MCLAIPGIIKKITMDQLGTRYGKVSFGGILKEICLDLVPDAEEDDWILAHAGMAISKVDEGEADKIMELLKELPGGEE